MWFVRNRTQSGNGLSAADQQRLAREKIRLAQAEKRLTGEVEQLEAAKAAAFQQGAACLSDRQRVQFARKVKEIEQQIVARDQQLALVARNLQTLAALDRLSETGQVAAQCSVGSLLDSLDLSAIRDQLDRVAAERDINQSRLDLLAGLLAPESGHATTDEDLTGILNAMEAASSATSVSRSNRSTDLNGMLRQTESS